MYFDKELLALIHCDDNVPTTGSLRVMPYDVLDGLTRTIDNPADVQSLRASCRAIRAALAPFHLHHFAISDVLYSTLSRQIVTAPESTNGALEPPSGQWVTYDWGAQPSSRADSSVAEDPVFKHAPEFCTALRDYCTSLSIKLPLTSSTMVLMAMVSCVQPCLRRIALESTTHVPVDTEWEETWTWISSKGFQQLLSGSAMLELSNIPLAFLRALTCVGGQDLLRSVSHLSIRDIQSGLSEDQALSGLSPVPTAFMPSLECLVLDVDDRSQLLTNIFFTNLKKIVVYINGKQSQMHAAWAAATSAHSLQTLELRKPIQRGSFGRDAIPTADEWLDVLTSIPRLSQLQTVIVDEDTCSLCTALKRATVYQQTVLAVDGYFTPLVSQNALQDLKDASSGDHWKEVQIMRPSQWERKGNAQAASALSQMLQSALAPAKFSVVDT